MSNFTATFKLPLNKTIPSPSGKLDSKGKIERERIQVGYAVVSIPLLADFGITAEQAKDDKGALMFDETGIPIYANDSMDWLQQSIGDKLASKVRNFFATAIKAQPDKENKEQVLQPDAGKILPVDFDMLTAESARTGEALKLRREARASFETYLNSQNKPAPVVTALGELFNNSSRVLGSASPKYVEALGMHADAWSKILTPEQTARFKPKLIELQESINAATEKEELDLS